MLCILFAVLTTICWGSVYIFRKISIDKADSYAQIKLTLCTGIAMGVLAVILLPFSESGLSVPRLLEDNYVLIPAVIIYTIAINKVAGGFYKMKSRFFGGKNRKKPVNTGFFEGVLNRHPEM